MYDDFVEKFIRGKSGKLLDVGCGLGYFVRRIKKEKNWDVFGCEISKTAVDFANKKLELDNVYCGRVEDSGFPKKHFDIITLWDVSDHLSDTRPMLRYLKTILKDDGVLFIHTPNIQIQLPKARLKKLFKGDNPGIHYLEARDHINIYSPQTI